MGILLYFVKNPLFTAALLGLIAMSVIASTQHWERASLTASLAVEQSKNLKLTTANADLKESVNALDAQIQQTKDAEAVLEDEIKSVAFRNRANAVFEKEIQDAPKQDDAPIAPVLRHTLDRLRH